MRSLQTWPTPCVSVPYEGRGCFLEDIDTILRVTNDSGYFLKCFNWDGERIGHRVPSIRESRCILHLLFTGVSM